MKRFLAALLLPILALLPGCGSYFFYPKKELIENPVLKRVAYEEVYFPTPDGLRLHGWLLHPPGDPRGTLLFLHGNAENISTHVNSVVWLVQEGYQVFLFDYRGYGKSEGQPSLSGVQRDGLAALDALLTLPGVIKDRIAVLGQSLGGAVSVYAVVHSPHRQHVKALVLDGSFAGYRKIAREKLASLILTWPLQYPLGLLIDDRYSPSRWIDRISPIPVVIIHGTADRVVPFPHGESLYRQAKEPKGFWIVRNRGHGESFEEEEVRKQLLRFLESVLENRKSGG
jgi:fermentation-respiration switch protein FrsA (DUF1100 family)